jgi:hypothetical protein
MRVVVLQSNYIPWKGYFDLINDADLFIFYDEVQYTKNDWRNRNQICTKNGLQWLTIQIYKDAVNGKISDVKLSPKWQKQHFKSLYLGYKSAPQFKQLEELMNDYLLDKKWTSLKDLNHYLIKKISLNIGMKTIFEDSTKYLLEGNKVERLLNLLVQVGATEYISGPSGKNYLNDFEYLFEENNIKLTYKIYPHYKEYLQLNKSFTNSVSILDTIAHIPYDNIQEYININI